MRLVKRNTIPMSTSEQIIEYITYHGQGRAHDLKKTLQISKVAVHKQLRKLLFDGKLKKIGKPPLVLYVLPHVSGKNLLQLEQIKKGVLPILKQAGVSKATLFGSYVRGDNTKKSDIDILVDLPKHATLLELIGIQQDIEEKLKRSVDVVEYEAINPLLKESILKYQYQLL